MSVDATLWTLIKGLAESRPIATPSAGPALEQRLRAKLADWRRLRTENVETGREVLQALLVGPLRFTLVIEARRRGYSFHGTIALERLVSGVIELKTLTGVASPSGNASCCIVEINEKWPMAA